MRRNSINMKKKINEKARKQKGITLIALIVTIVVLLILAGVSVVMLTGENGLLKKATTAKENTNKSTATEKMNLKITNAQMNSYVENEQMPTLQELADIFYEDDEIKSVVTKDPEIASKEKVTVGNHTSIYTVLEEYPQYEFEINNKLQIASINGTKIADTSNGSQDNTELLNRISALESTVSSLQDANASMQTRVQALENASSTSFEIVDFTTPGTAGTWKKVASYPTGYTRDNCIINTGYFYLDDINQKLILPYPSAAPNSFGLEMRADGIYANASHSSFLNKSGKLYLQKIN